MRAAKVPLLLVCSVSANVIINEVSDKGTLGTCDGADWVELVNVGADVVDLDGWMLCDSGGCQDNVNGTIAMAGTIAPGEYRLVCPQAQPKWVGDSDTISLVDEHALEADITTLGGDGEFGKSWARWPDSTGPFRYTYVPTPGAPYADSVIINEVSDKGTLGACDGQDWVELVNVGAEEVDLDGWSLCDSDGCADNDTIALSAMVVAPSGYLLVCPQARGWMHRKWISDSDTITLINAQGMQADATMLGGDGEFEKTWARWPDSTGSFRYTFHPTPGAPYAKSVIINEVSDKGTLGTCDGADWVELVNVGADVVDLDGWMLCDSGGCQDNVNGTIAMAGTIAPGEYRLVCPQAQPKWVGDSDTISLVDEHALEADITTLGGDGEFGKSWARWPDSTGPFRYTYVPTPGAPYAEAVETLQVNEVADKGDPTDPCDGADWVELRNPTHGALPLSGLLLSDDKGPHNEKALALGGPGCPFSLGTGELLLLCRDGNASMGGANYAGCGFAFGIGKNDVVSLHQIDAAADRVVLVDEAVGCCAGDANLSYGRPPRGGAFSILLWRTPGTANAVAARQPSPRVTPPSVLRQPSVLASPFPSSVVSFEEGSGAGFGKDRFPEVVLGPPQGAGNAGSLDVLSLGEAGEVVLRFDGIELVDGDGPDLLVFENPFTNWYETGVVAVSADGMTWFEWNCDPEDATGLYPGCAGVGLVWSNPDNGIDPTDPESAGGDAFDLADLDIPPAHLADLGVRGFRYVRIRDSGRNRYGGISGGFDLDAIAAVNGEPLPAVSTALEPVAEQIMRSDCDPAPDLDGDGAFRLADAVYVAEVWSGSKQWSRGAMPCGDPAGDFDGDGAFRLADAVYLAEVWAGKKVLGPTSDHRLLIAWKIPVEITEHEVTAGTTVAFEWQNYHNVMLLSTQAEYDACSRTGEIVAGTEVNEYEVKLTETGTYFYICEVRYHCEAPQNQKVKIVVK